jgi:hypothetical protein
MAGDHDCCQVMWERATNPTSSRLGISAKDAHTYVLDTVQRLTEGDYVECVQLGDSWFDVYACYRDDYGWYVKMGENDDGLLVISHHEPERGKLTTVAGTVVEASRPATPKNGGNVDD